MASTHLAAGAPLVVAGQDWSIVDAMSTSRQDAGYPVEESIKDAVVVMTAFCVPDTIDDRLVHTAMENALAGTDHTGLVYQLGLIMRTMTRLGSQGLREHPAEFARAIAERRMYAVGDHP